SFFSMLPAPTSFSFLSLHAALPILDERRSRSGPVARHRQAGSCRRDDAAGSGEVQARLMPQDGRKADAVGRVVSGRRFELPRGATLGARLVRRVWIVVGEVIEPSVAAAKRGGEVAAGALVRRSLYRLVAPELRQIGHVPRGRVSALVRRRHTIHRQIAIIGGAANTIGADIDEGERRGEGADRSIQLVVV